MRIRSRLTKKGFTLLEMTIVIVIILAFMAMSLPFFKNFSSSANINTSTREIVTILRTARSYAVSQNQDFDVVCNTSTTPNGFWIRNVTSGAMIDKGYKLPASVSFNAAVTVTFKPNGGITSGNTDIIITNTDGKTKTIRVNGLTGVVEIL